MDDPFDAGPPAVPPSPPWHDVAVAPPPSDAHRSPRRVWTVFLLFAVTLAAAMFAGTVALVGAVVVQHGVDGLKRVENLMSLTETVLGTNISLAAVETTLLVLTVLAAMLSPVPLRQRLRVQPSGLSVGQYLILLLGMLGVGQFMDSALVLLQVDRGPSLETLEAVLASAGVTGLLCSMLVMGVGAGFGEEFLCRGFIQTRLSERWGAAWAILVTSVLFGVMHFDIVHSTLAFSMGLYLGYITERSGSIRPAVFCHMLNNMISVFLSWWLPEGLSAGTHVALLGSSTVVGVACVAYAGLRVRRRPAC